jgi:hypothetical protein
MKKYTFLFGLFMVLAFSANAQYDCKVMVKALQGQYNGACKRGLAHGEGIAKGEDEYVGSFKKGYPHGFGVYTYKNGSNYIGNYTKGKKDGYGLLNTLSNGGHLTQEYGLWVADSLIIPNDPKALYKVKERRGVKLIDPELTRDPSVKNEVWLNFQTNGVPDKSVVITNAEISSGHELDTQNRSLNTLVAFSEIEEFPVTFRVEYEIRKTSHFEMINCVVEVILFTAGRWDIDLNH